jgi:hypothetical protein
LRGFFYIIPTASFKEVMICLAAGNEKGRKLRNIN